MASTDELLTRHRPALKYDSQETYFADSAAEWVETPGNVLLDGAGRKLAAAGSGLSLALLATACKQGTAKADQVLSDPSRNYVEQARAAHGNPLYANQMYGRAIVEGSAVWLQYWFYYFYNDFNLIGTIVKAGLHECDWEMVQLRVPDGQQTPDVAVYAQHKHAERRDWRQVDVLPGTERPIVYPARGSHASYFEPGMHWTGYWFEHADGKRRSPDPQLQIVREEEDSWLWMRWPGSWGDTKADGTPGSANSPRSPGHHGQWDRPSVLLEQPPPIRPTGVPTPPPAPSALAEWEGEAIRLHYAVQPASNGARPTILTVTVNSPDEPHPPVTRSYPIRYESGTIDLSTDVTPTQRYDIYVSCATAGDPPLASPSTRVDLPPAA